jgi:hypothetical protein
MRQVFDVTLQENPGLSVSRQLSKRMRVLAQYGRERARSAAYLRRSLSGTRAVSGVRQGHEALVIANGPSARRLNPGAVRTAVEEGMDVFALNAYILTDLGGLVPPTHYVLSDPSHHPAQDTELSREIWRRLDASPEITLIAPHTWYPVLVGRRPTTLYFNECGLQGWTRSISPLRPMGYIYLTAYKALAYALHLGYDSVNIIGFDNSIFMYVSVDEHNRMSVMGDTHFYSSALGSTVPGNPEFPHYPLGMADWLFDFSLCFYDLRRCFAGRPVVNLDGYSLTDAFPKATRSPLVHPDAV